MYTADLKTQYCPHVQHIYLGYVLLVSNLNIMLGGL